MEWHGVIPAIMTPFRDDLSVDADLLRREVDALVGAGCTGIVALGSLGESAFTLFQIMTLESWSMGIVRPVMEAYPYAWIFFVTYILVSTFTMLNLFIAVVVNAMQAEHAREIEADKAQAAHSPDDALRVEMQALRDEVRALRAVLAGTAHGNPAAVENAR